MDVGAEMRYGSYIFYLYVNVMEEAVDEVFREGKAGW